MLSGGGAKGVAHIGALKVIEEAGIPIDMISGTSMGAIVGGLYSIGYDAHTLDSLVKIQDWPTLLTDRINRENMSIAERQARDTYILSLTLDNNRRLKMPLGFLGGYSVLNLLSELTIGYHDSIPFNTLPTPFACVGYDMVTGKEVVMDQGILPLAIRTSMSIPGVFRPVESGDMLLIDGGVSNNFPVDVAQDMGAEVIIGIDVSSGPRTKDKLNNVAELFDQLAVFTGEAARQRNIEHTDLYVQPHIAPYTSASFTSEAIDSLIKRGEEAMRAKWNELVALKEEIGAGESECRDLFPQVTTLDINSVCFEIDNSADIDNKDLGILLRTTNIADNSTISIVEIHEAINNLLGSGMFVDVRYRLDNSSPHNLTFSMTRKSRSSLNLGLRFDTEVMASILLNATLSTKGLNGGTYGVTARLSENPYVKAYYSLGRATERKLMISYTYRYNTLDFYEKGHKVNNVDFTNHTFDINFSNIQVRNLKATIGLKYDYYDYSSFISPIEYVSNPRNEGLFAYYLSTTFDNTDHLYYPRRGLIFDFKASVVTDDLVTYNGKNPFGAIQAGLRGAISVSSRVTFLPAFYGRVLISDNLAYPWANLMGGTHAGRYMPQQMPFVGIRKVEAFDNSLLVARLDTRVRLWRKHYVTGMVNFAQYNDSLFDIFKGRGGNVWGGGVGYSYDTFLGPITFILDASTRSHGIRAYLSMGYYF